MPIDHQPQRVPDLKPMRLGPAAVAVFLACLAGCSGPTHGEVKGMVTLDGHPLKEGTIRFTPIDGKTGTAGAFIADGKFEAKVPIAKHKVEISSPKLPKGITHSKQLKRGTVDEG